MSIRYRVVCWLMVLKLIGLGWNNAVGQGLPGAEDSLKGRIWTITAQQVWTDTKQKTPPPQWVTSKEFEDWLIRNPDPAAKSELGILRGAVIGRIGKGQTGSAGQVAQAIVGELTQRRQQKVGALARVNVTALQTELAPFTQFATAADTASDTVAGPADTSLASAGNSTATPAALPAASSSLAEDPNPAPDSLVSSERMAAVPAVQSVFFGLSPYLVVGLAAGLGALAGALLMRRKMAKESRLRQHKRHAASLQPSETELTDAMNSPKFNKLQRENQRLQKQLDELKRELYALKDQLAGSTTQLKPKQSALAPAPPPVQDQTEDHDDLLNVGLGTIAPPESVSEPPATQLPPATRYGPVQETPFVEERKIVDNPLPQLALMLTVNPRNPDQATFTLNPHVNQSMLIGDGLNRLQKFFEYDPPVGRISSVAAAAAGTLQRHADGWQVVERARLTIR